MLRAARAHPLVGIMEFFLYRTIQYFMERFGLADAAMHNNQKIYCCKIDEYMEEAQKKALLHRVLPVRSVERRFEVYSRAKGRLAAGWESATQECTIRNDKCICTCNKPKLLHKPCTHVIAACLYAGGL